MYFDFCIHCATCGKMFWVSNPNTKMDTENNVRLCSKSCLDLFQYHYQKYISNTEIY